MCGIVGVVSTDQCNQQIYDSLLLLQHRGQDSTGIATMDGSVFHINKSKGDVLNKVEKSNAEVLNAEYEIVSKIVSQNLGLPQSDKKSMD